MPCYVYSSWEDHFYISPPHVPNPLKTGALVEVVRDNIFVTGRLTAQSCDMYPWIAAFTPSAMNGNTSSASRVSRNTERNIFSAWI